VNIRVNPWLEIQTLQEIVSPPIRTVFLATDEHGFTRMQISLKNRQQTLFVNIRGLPFAFYP
jgi:hypothetical protein